MGFWDQVWATVLGGVIVAGLGALAGWVVTRVRRELGHRPDWSVRRTPSGTLEFTRERRRTAFQVGGLVYSAGHATQVDFASFALIADHQRGSKFNVPITPEMTGVFLTWIDGERLSIDFAIPKEVDQPISLTAKRQRRRLAWVSA